MANIEGLKTELLSMLGATANLTATEKQKLRDRFVTHYPAEWAAYLAGGGTDTPSNRGKFAADSTVEYWRQIYRDQDRREKIAAIVSETLSNSGTVFPTFEANVDLVLEADSGVLNGSGTAATDGQTVATWTDLMGNYDVTNGTDATRPTFVASSQYNNKPAIWFGAGGTKHFLQNTDFINARTGAGWVIAARSVGQFPSGWLVCGTQAGQFVGISGNAGWSIGNYTVGNNSAGTHCAGGSLLTLKLDTTQGTSATRWVFRQNKTAKTISFTGDALAAQMPGLGTGLGIGGNPSNAEGGYYEVFGMIHFSETPTDADITAAEAYFEAKYFTIPKQRINIVCEGDSITKGYTPALIPNAHLSYPYLLGEHFGGANNWSYENSVIGSFDTAKTHITRNWGEVAETIVNINNGSQPVTQVDAFLDDWALRDICILWIGTNDLQASTATATVLAEIEEWTTGRKALTSHREVWVGTILPREDGPPPGSFEADRATVNAGLAALNGVDGVIDFASIPEFADPSHFGDGVHLSAPDYVLVAQKAYDTLTA